MNGAKYWIHVVCLFIIQLTILDNIQLHSYVYINIYILAILVLPYVMKELTVLFLAFLFCLIVDLANNLSLIHIFTGNYVPGRFRRLHCLRYRPAQ